MNINSKNTGSQRISDGCHQKEKISCRVHKGFEVDCICFHPQCRESATQLLCAMCGHSEQPHCNHQSEVFPVYKTSPGFRLLNNIADEELAKYILGQKQIITKELDLLEKLALNMVEETKKRVERKLECLWALPSGGAVFKVCQKLKGEGMAHSNCCLSIINTFRQFQEQSSDPLSQAKKFLTYIVHQEVAKTAQQLERLQMNLRDIGIDRRDLNASMQAEKESNSINKIEADNAVNMNSAEIKQQISLNHQAPNITNSPSQGINLPKKVLNQNKSSVQFIERSSLNNSKSKKEKKRVIRSIKQKNTVNQRAAINCTNTRIEIQPSNGTIQLISLNPTQRGQRSNANLVDVPNGLDMIDENSVAFWRPLSNDEQIAANLFLRQRQNIANILFQDMNYHYKYYKRYLKTILHDVKTPAYQSITNVAYLLHSKATIQNS